MCGLRTQKEISQACEQITGQPRLFGIASAMRNKPVGRITLFIPANPVPEEFEPTNWSRGRVAVRIFSAAAE
jgi:hypothetical protein